MVGLTCRSAVGGIAANPGRKNRDACRSFCPGILGWVPPEFARGWLERLIHFSANGFSARARKTTRGARVLPEAMRGGSEHSVPPRLRSAGTLQRDVIYHSPAGTVRPLGTGAVARWGVFGGAPKTTCEAHVLPEKEAYGSRRLGWWNLDGWFRAKGIVAFQKR